MSARKAENRRHANREDGGGDSQDGCFGLGSLERLPNAIQRGGEGCKGEEGHRPVAVRAENTLVNQLVRRLENRVRGF